MKLYIFTLSTLLTITANTYCSADGAAASSSTTTTSLDTFNQWRNYLKKFGQPRVLNQKNIEYLYPYQNWQDHDPRWNLLIPQSASCLQYFPTDLLHCAQGNYNRDLDTAIESNLSAERLEPIIKNELQYISNKATLLHTQAMLVRHQTTFITEPTQSTHKKISYQELIKLVEEKIQLVEKSEQQLSETNKSNNFQIINEEEVLGKPTNENNLTTLQHATYYCKNLLSHFTNQNSTSTPHQNEQNTIAAHSTQTNENNNENEEEFVFVTHQTLTTDENMLQDILHAQQQTPLYQAQQMANDTIQKVAKEFEEYMKAVAVLFRATDHASSACAGLLDQGINANLPDDN